MTDILNKVQSLAIVHCGQASFTLRDERKGKVILNTGRVKNVRGTASVKSFYWVSRVEYIVLYFIIKSYDILLTSFDSLWHKLVAVIIDVQFRLVYSL